MSATACGARASQATRRRERAGEGLAHGRASPASTSACRRNSRAASSSASRWRAPGAGAPGAAVRRAAQQSRRQAAPPDARGDPRAAAAARPHRRLCHPRPGGGAGGLRPHHRDECRPHRAAGRAARPLRAAGHALPGALHGRVQPGARQRPPPRCRQLPPSGRRRNGRADTAADGEAHSRSARKRSRSRPRPGPPARSGTIAKASYLGTHMEYSIDTAAGALFATCPRVERPLAAGDKVALVLAPRGVIVVAGT